jgi:predicted nucleic acid-binding protein
MRTTLDIGDELLRRAKKRAAAEGTSLRQVGEAALRLYLGTNAQGRATGNLVHDAHIAAVLLEHGVHEIWTADRDFARFPGLKVHDPFH